ncbi:MAG: tRNA-modifying protein YgfZ, partial [Mariprofundaceae bacterium]
ELNGVSYEKGCYIGQEVTSRMHWRKSIKKRLYHVEITSLPTSLPCSILTTAKIGILTSASAYEGEKQAFGIAHLAINAVESGQPMQLEDGSIVRIIEVCHV